MSALFVCGEIMSDKRHQWQKRRDARREQAPDGKTEYERIISGEQEPTGSQKGWKNLKPIPITARSEEERREICQKGGQAVQRIHGEKKTAKESLDRMLSILATDDILNSADIEKDLVKRLKRENPDMTLYDAVNAAALGRALSGNVKALEYIRDTRGDAPVKQVEITENITTDADRALLKKINDRLEAGTLVVVEDQTAGNPADDMTKDNIKNKNDPE